MLCWMWGGGALWLRRGRGLVRVRRVGWGVDVNCFFVFLVLVLVLVLCEGKGVELS